MNLVLKDKDGNNRYLLAKLDPGWELKKWDAGGKEITKGKYKGSVTSEGWKKMAGGNGIYPHSIKHAIHIIGDDLLLDQAGTYSIMDGLDIVVKKLSEIDMVAEKLSA